MKLGELSTKGQAEYKLKVKNPENGSIALNLVLRDPLSFDYKKNQSEIVPSVYAKFKDPAEANIVCEAISSIKSWDIDDHKCNLKNMIELFSNPETEWIAVAVYDFVTAKKFLGVTNLKS